MESTTWQDCFEWRIWRDTFTTEVRAVERRSSGPFLSRAQGEGAWGRFGRPSAIDTPICPLLPIVRNFFYATVNELTAKSNEIIGFTNMKCSFLRVEPEFPNAI
ncbi:unnamed protein product [Leptosia nina]|uniref:Uncharacterized protein n=1 Tax=Leptosia nina TaxID=320188 RepID=A0AAV1K4H2_9NEOP